MARVTWFDDVYHALYELGGKAHLNQIYNKVQKIRRDAGRSLPPSWMSIVRATLEDRCSEAYFRLGLDVFYMPQGKGAGVWAIRPSRVLAEHRSSLISGCRVAGL
jgi:hypothetical protein